MLATVIPILALFDPHEPMDLIVFICIIVIAVTHLFGGIPWRR